MHGRQFTGKNLHARQPCGGRPGWTSF